MARKLLLMIKIVIFIFGAKIVTIMSFCKFQFVARKLLSFFTKDPVGKGPLKKARARALLLALPAATPAGVGAQAQAVLSGLKPRQPRHRWRPWLLWCAVLRERAWAAWLRGLRGSSCSIPPLLLQMTKSSVDPQKGTSKDDVFENG